MLGHLDCLTLVLSLGSISAAWNADFRKGLTAAESYDYATALRETKFFAEQENAGIGQGLF